MNESSIKLKTKSSEKNSRKFFGVLRRLVKSDNSINNILKVTVYKDEINDEKKQFFIAPSIFISSERHLYNHNSTQNKNKNIIENSIIEEIQSSNNAEFMEYPDSSDFDD